MSCNEVLRPIGGVLRVRSAAAALSAAAPVTCGERYDLLGQAVRLLAVAVPLRWEPGRPPYKAAGAAPGGVGRDLGR